jgi:hypothetical protein
VTQGILESYVTMNFGMQVAALGSSKPQDWPYAVHILSHVVIHDL